MATSTAAWTLTLSTLLALSAASLAAQAQTADGQFSGAAPSPTKDSEPAATREWYGLPIVIADGAAAGSLIAAAVLAEPVDSPTLTVLLASAGVGTYALGGPIVHFSEGRVGAGFGSLGLRVGAPMVGGFVGALIGLELSSLEGLAVGGALGLVGGVITALAVDYAVLAYRPVTSKRSALSVTPTYQPTTGRAGLVLSGTW